MSLLLAVLIAVAPPALIGQEPPLRVFLRGGAKTHGEGEHDHPRFVEEWKLLLGERGATVGGGLEFPTADELARTDVLVMYAAEGGSIHGEERERFAAYIARGGGIAVLHDAVCGDDPHWWKTAIGGAWEHGHSKWHTGTIDLYVADREHPITAGLSNFRFEDEIYRDLHLVPEARVLVNGFHDVFHVTPQTWVLEKEAYRAFVSIQGHYHASFAHPAWRALVLRGIAWAGKRDVDSLLSAGEKASLAYPPGGPTAPEKAAESIELHPDFELSLVVSEPLIHKPISIDWDPAGRMWVAETIGYPDKSKFSGLPPRDEISVLVDTDGDGRVDRKSRFAGELDLVTSFVFHRDGVIASASPEILWLRDQDGDGVAESREVVFAGFGFGDTHAVVNNMRWGLDGWIYACQGYSGNASRHVTNAEGRDFGAIGNGIFRFRPDGSAIEMVSAYGSNTWGLDFSADGELFFTMANGAHLRHVVVPERVLSVARVGRVESWKDLPDHDRVKPLVVHDDAPYAQIDFVGGFTAASGCLIYSGGAWPEEWWGDHFTCEPTVHVVHHDEVEPDGVSYRAHEARDAEFLAGRDLWFRPVHLRTGPDGAVYLLDFYNQAVVHNDTRGPPHGPTNAAVRPDRDHEHGRIWRIQHRAARKLDQPDLSRSSPEQVVAALGHPNSWQRMTAQRLLVERTYPFASLKLQSTEPKKGRNARLHAACCLEQLDAMTSNVLEHLAIDTDPSLRKLAARITARGVGELSLERAHPWLLELVADTDESVQRDALVALGEFDPSDELLRRVVEMASYVHDDWSRSAAVRAGARDPALLVQTAFAFTPPSDAVFGLALEVVRASARRRDTAEAAGVLSALARHGRANAPALRRCLSALSDGLGSHFRARPSGEVLDALAELLDPADIETALAALPLLERYGAPAPLVGLVEQLAETLWSTLEEVDRPPRERARALEALLEVPERRTAAIGAAAGLLGPSIELEVQLAAIAALGRTGADEAAGILCGAYGALSARPRSEIVELCLARPSWACLFLEAVADERIAARSLGLREAHRLRTHADAQVAGRAREVLAAGAASSAAVEELVAKLLPEVDRPGDAARGAPVFRENCAACHTVGGEGGHVGPDLTGMGARGAREILPVILDPNRAVEAAYAEWVVHATDGQVHSGVLARETDAAVLLRSSAGEREIARADIASMQSTGRSPMPTGFEALGAEALRDLMAFLSGGVEGYRVLDLRLLANASSRDGLYDRKRDDKPLVFARHGIVDVGGVPYELIDPSRSALGANAVVLKGGRVADWESKRDRPRSVEIPVGFELARVHALGWVSAWGWPCSQDQRPVLTWTWIYADGTSEPVELRDGVDFSDWIGRYDVPGSEFVPDVLAEKSWGQVRYRAVAPSERKLVASIRLESFDNDMAPTFFALTAELPGAPQRAAPARAAIAAEPADVLIVGGGSSHDFGRWFRDADLAALRAAGIGSARYTDVPAEVLPALASAKVLVLANNQPLPGADLRRAIFDFVERGGGLLLLHASTWHNWPDWPEFNARLVGGGARSHEALQELEARVVASGHPIADGLPSSFRVRDELYRFEPLDGFEREVLAVGRSLETGAEYPVAWTSAAGKGRIVGVTLGHDAGAHESSPFQRLYTNAVRWLR